MDTDSNQTSEKTGLALLRERHQELAKTAARTGITPSAFKGDPAFADLAEGKRSSAASNT